MTVYVVGCEGKGKGLVKIGHSADPQKRLRQIASGCPYPVKILWLSSSGHGFITEQRVHRAFGDRHHYGEWFDFGDDDPVALVKGVVRKIERKEQFEFERKYGDDLDLRIKLIMLGG